MNTVTKNILETIKDNFKVKDELYRALWLDYVKEDVESLCEDLGVDLKEEDIDYVANRYVYHGDYDCNLNYWDNIENLINKTAA